MKYDRLVLFVRMSAPPSCMSYYRSIVCFFIDCTILNDCCGNLWISGSFPANFTEGDTSQATSSPVGGPTISAVASLDLLQGTVKDVTRAGGVHKEKNRFKRLRKTNEVLYEYLETGAVRGKGKEPDFVSGDESTNGDERGMDLKFPSSSGTTHSDAEKGDSEGEKSVDSKERECADEEDVEEDDVVKFPTLKSYDPQFISPQEPRRVKGKQDDHANLKLTPNDVGEDQGKKTPPMEVPGSECLDGRNPLKMHGTPTVGQGDDIRGVKEDSIFKTPEKTTEKTPEKTSDKTAEKTSEESPVKTSEESPVKTSEKSPARKKMKAVRVKDVPESEGRQVPSKSLAGLGRVMTRSQEKLQSTQVKKKKKRRGT